MKLHGILYNLDLNVEVKVFDYDHKTIKWNERANVFELNSDLIELGSEFGFALIEKKMFYLRNPNTGELAEVRAKENDAGYNWQVFSRTGSDVWSVVVKQQLLALNNWAVTLVNSFSMSYITN